MRRLADQRSFPRCSAGAASSAAGRGSCRRAPPQHRSCRRAGARRRSFTRAARLVRELARALEPVQGDVRDLAGGLVLPGRLPQLLRRAGGVEDVVDDLEEDAKLVAERPPGRRARSAAGRRRRSRSSRRRGAGGRSSARAAVGRPSASRPPSLGDVEVLPADHAERRVGELPRDGRRRVAQREPEGLGEERVAGEDGNVLAEAHVRVGCPRRRSSSSSAGRSSWTRLNVWTSSSEHPAGRSSSGSRAERLAGGQAEHRPDPLAAAEERVPERLLELPSSSGERQLGEEALGQLAQVVRPLHRPPAARAPPPPAPLWPGRRAPGGWRPRARGRPPSRARARRLDLLRGAWSRATASGSPRSRLLRLPRHPTEDPVHEPTGLLARVALRERRRPRRSATSGGTSPRSSS